MDSVAWEAFAETRFSTLGLPPFDLVSSRTLSHAYFSVRIHRASLAREHTTASLPVQLMMHVHAQSLYGCAARVVALLTAWMDKRNRLRQLERALHTQLALQFRT
jgi:hypothetical protein